MTPTSRSPFAQNYRPVATIFFVLALVVGAVMFLASLLAPLLQSEVTHKPQTTNKQERSLLSTLYSLSLVESIFLSFFLSFSFSCGVVNSFFFFLLLFLFFLLLFLHCSNDSLVPATHIHHICPPFYIFIIQPSSIHHKSNHHISITYSHLCIMCPHRETHR